MRDELKKDVVAMLEKRDYESVTVLYKKNFSVLRILISTSYDKKLTLAWRAMESIGMITANLDSDGARNVAQRMMWMMRDESGGNAWSGPEVIGEIIRSKPDKLKDLVPILESFSEEDMFKVGVMRGLGRIAEVRADLVEPLAHSILKLSKHPDPAVKGHAVYALSRLPGHEADLGAFKDDATEFMFFENGELAKRTVGSFVASMSNIE